MEDYVEPAMAYYEEVLGRIAPYFFAPNLARLVAKTLERWHYDGSVVFSKVDPELQVRAESLWTEMIQAVARMPDRYPNTAQKNDGETHESSD